MSLFGFKEDTLPEEIKLVKYEFFDMLKDLENKRGTWDKRSEEFKSQYSQFMVTRLLSTYDIYLPFIAEISRFKKMSNEAHFNYIESILSMFGKVPRITWGNYHKCYKKEKDESKETIANLMKYFEVGLSDVKVILQFLMQEQIDKINDIYCEERITKLKNK